MKALKIEVKKDNPTLEVFTLVLEGVPADEISEQCIHDVPSMIVMSTHGYSGMENLLIGSVTERVIQSSPVPVISFRPKNDETNKGDQDGE